MNTEETMNTEANVDLAATKIVVVGQGYVGLPLAVRAVEVGYTVVGYDIDANRIGQLAEGDSFIEDAPVRSTRRPAFDTGRFTVFDQLSSVGGFDVAVISVPTPLRDGDPDLSYVESAAHTVGRHLRTGATVVLESTTYPGTTEQLVAPILEAESGLRAGADFHLGYSPERIDPSNKTWTFVNTPKVVSGIDAASLAAVDGFYSQLVDTTVVVADTKIAELTKLLENTFRHVNVALVNELVMYANDLGITSVGGNRRRHDQAVRVHAFHPRARRRRPLSARRSRSLWAAAKSSLGKSFRFVELANDINEACPTTSSPGSVAS